MILHFLTDDKFSEYVLRHFSPLKSSCECIVITCSLVLKSITGYNNLKRINPYSKEFIELVNSLSQYKAIVLHGLFWPWEEYVLQHVPNQVKVAWMFWGGEIYGRKDLQGLFLAPRTKRVLFWHTIKRGIKHRGKSYCTYEIPKEFYKRIDFCLTDIPEEFQFASGYLGNSMEHLLYNYYSIEDTLGDAVNLSVEGNNILLDNSGTIEGNHFDAIPLIKRGLLDKESRVVVPLSYGDSWVINRIIKEGEKSFKTAFTPIKGFLPRNEYNRLLSCCSIAIMNHYRPQALGNIITSLWLGARVYMSEKSLQYTFLKRIGIKLFSIEKDLSKDLAISIEKLSRKDMMENRRILNAYYGKETVDARVREIVKTLDS